MTIAERAEVPNARLSPTPFVDFQTPEARAEKAAEIEFAHREMERLCEVLAESQRHAGQVLATLETLLSSVPVGVAFVDLDFRIRYINAILASVNGASVEEQLGRPVPDVVPELWPQLEPIYRTVIETEMPVLNREVERPNAAAPHEHRVWLASYYPVRVDARLIGVGAIVADITDGREAEEFRATVLENMAEGLCVLDRESRLVMMNSAASTMLGYEKRELVGKALHPAIHFQHADGSPYPERECQLLQAHREGRTIRTSDEVFTRKDGTIFPVAYSASPLRRGDRVRGAVVVFRDVTKEKAEQAFVQRKLDGLTWVGRIRDALAEGRMVLYAQPIAPLKNGDGREELLLRMLGRGGEVIAPGEFLPTAEKSGMIAEIDRWVLGESIQLAATGRRVHVNVSAESVGDPDFLALVRELLQRTQADPSNITFEITETAVMHDLNEAVIFARCVTGLGCQLALDDFGTGFGSLTYLKRLPFRYLKIDQEFVRGLVSSPTNQHIVKAILNLAEGFGQETIAEGVEDEATLDLLRQYGVGFAQGFHVGRPTGLLSD